jgi:DNA-binding transcriptional LysR family regulator
LADIADEPLISLTDGAELRESINRSFASAGLKPNILTTVQLAMAACQFVRITGGLTIVDPITANSPNNVDLVIRPLVEKIDVPIYLYTSAGTTRSQGLEQFIAYCRQRLSMLVI